MEELIKEDAKVLRVAQVMGKLNAGGVESVIYNYYKHLNYDKIQFDFIIDEDSTCEIPQEILQNGARCFVVPPYQHTVKYVSALKKLFKQNGYTIVHSNMNTLAVFSLYAAWKAKVPVRICHNHSTSGKGEWLKNVVKFFLKPFAKLFATDYFACSEYAGKWLYGKRAVKKGKVTVINNAIDLQKFAFNEDIRNRVRKELNIEDKFVIGHVGRFMPQKNHEFLIETFNEIYKINKNAVLLLVGDGPLREDIEKKVNDLKLEDAVNFVGIKNEVSGFYQAMDVFVFPSTYEGLGVALIEAQASGLKCFAANTIPQEAKVTENLHFLPIDGGISLWVDKILNVKTERGSAVDAEKYDITVQARELEKFYLDRLNEKK